MMDDDIKYLNDIGNFLKLNKCDSILIEEYKKSLEEYLKHNNSPRFLSLYRKVKLKIIEIYNDTSTIN